MGVRLLKTGASRSANLLKFRSEVLQVVVSIIWLFYRLSVAVRVVLLLGLQRSGLIKSKLTVMILVFVVTS